MPLLPGGIPREEPQMRSSVGGARHPRRAGFTLFYVLDDPKGLPCCPSSHGDVVLRGGAGGERVHRRGVAQNLVLRHCKRPGQGTSAANGKNCLVGFPVCLTARSVLFRSSWLVLKHQMVPDYFGKRKQVGLVLNGKGGNSEF